MSKLYYVIVKLTIKWTLKVGEDTILANAGIDCDNNAAIEILGEHYRILTSAPDGKAYKLFKRSGNVHIVELPQNSEYTPLADLLRRG